MQDELTAAGLDVTIVGLNAAGFEAGNASMCAGRDLAWLQDTAQELVWASWGITYRDVIVLDENNEVVAIYNLTDNDLGDPSRFAELKAIFEAEASGP